MLVHQFQASAKSNHILKHHLPLTQTDYHMLTSSNGDVAPQGDSGGPFTVKNSTTSQHDLVGVVSWGEGCAAVRIVFAQRW